MGLLTTREAGTLLGVTLKRVQQFISEGRLPAQRFGRVFLVDAEDLKLVVRHKTGRPPSKKAATKQPATKPATKKGSAKRSAKK